MSEAKREMAARYRPPVRTLVAWKLVVCIVAATAVLSFPSFFHSDMYWANLRSGPDTPPDRWTPLHTWEAQHHLFLAGHGYGPGRGSNEFFPLWPMLVRLFAPLLGGSLLASGLVLANLLSVAAAVAFHRLVWARFADERLANWSLWLLLAHPGSWFLSLVHPDSLFLLLAVAMMAALATGRWWAAAASSFLLCLTRPAGLLSLAPLVWDRCRQWRRDRRVCWLEAAGLLLPVAGVGVYLAWMAWTTGDPLAGLRVASRFLPRRAAGSLLDPVGFVAALVDLRSWHAPVDSSLDRVVFVAVVACLPRLWKINREFFVYALALGVVPPLFTFMSYTRHVPSVFPVFVALAAILRGRRLAAPWVLALLAGVQLILAARQLTYHWAG